MPAAAIGATIDAPLRTVTQHPIVSPMSLAPVKSTVPPKAILFDLDDTLWPIAPVIAAAETLLHDWLAKFMRPRWRGSFPSRCCASIAWPCSTNNRISMAI